MSLGTVLVAEDETRTRAEVATALRAEGFEVHDVADGREALDLIRRMPVDVVVSDHKMPRMDGLELLQHVREDFDVPFILYSAVAGAEVVFKAGRHGAVDFLEFPFGIDDELVPAIRRNLPSAVPPLEQRHGAARIVGCSPALAKLRQQVVRLAQSRTSVLITGETGSGKEVVAQALHEESRRGPMLAVAVPELPESLLEAELFGHEKGAFTGAVSARAGFFERADGGTLFLDEIGDTPLALQAKLLRALETGQFRRLGSTKSRHIDIRFLAATHRDLRQWSLDGRFREDLYFRLSQASICVPPLRDRPEDIDALSDLFLQQLTKDLKIEVPLLSEDFLQVLRNQAWRGNARELKSVLQSALLWWNGGETLTALHALEAIAASSPSRSSADRVLCQRMLDVYRKHSGNQEAARADLSMTRGQWRYRWDRFGLDILGRRKR